ncbi:hypothetical protein SDC9_185226 [bioreactor metagenome]|uniref:Uncharacterized protein n=1 Tax=bioreactor metagenome TaxID=1076179 RepID=A0A645HGL5_9ZZZZ
MGLLNQREVSPHIMGLAAVAGQPRCVAVADELVKPCRFLYIRGRAVTGQGVFDKVEIRTGVEDITQGIYEFLWLLPHTAVKIDQ